MNIYHAVLLIIIIGLVSYIVYRLATTSYTIENKTDNTSTVDDSSSIDDVGGRTVFGELSVAAVNPVFQIDGLYGIDETNDFQKDSYLGGSQTVDSEGLMTVSSGTNAEAFSSLRSKRSVRYRPGQGSMARFTAMFPNGHVTNYQQVAGYINDTDILGIGYNYPSSKNEFATIRRYKGKSKIYEVEVTAAASGNETFRITLNGVNFDVSCTSGTTLHNASELANSDYTEWVVDIVNTSVYFLYGGPPGPLEGSFSVSNQTPGGTMEATGTSVQDGLSPTDLWTYQSEWNIDKLDGSGNSKMNLDPTKQMKNWKKIATLNLKKNGKDIGSRMFVAYKDIEDKKTIVYIVRIAKRKF